MLDIKPTLAWSTPCGCQRVSYRSQQSSNCGTFSVRRCRSTAQLRLWVFVARRIADWHTAFKPVPQIPHSSRRRARTRLILVTPSSLSPPHSPPYLPVLLACSALLLILTKVRLSVIHIDSTPPLLSTRVPRPTEISWRKTNFFQSGRDGAEYYKGVFLRSNRS